MAERIVITAPRMVHYAWVVAGAGTLAMLCGLGLARFAFGMMLPSMSAALSLNYQESGWLGAAYLIGYLSAVAMLPLVVSRLGVRIMISGGLLAVALSMLGIAWTYDFIVVWLFYFLTGIGSGATIVPVLSQASQWFYPSHRGVAAGLLMSGAGLGIIASGFIVPRLAPAFGFLAWQTGWLVFAALSMVAAVVAYVVIPNHPRDIGEMPFGKAPSPSSVIGGHLRPRVLLVAHLSLIFGVYGATYMLYVTFIVTSMVHSYGMSEAEAGELWAWFGFLSMFSGLLFGSLSDRIGRRAGLAVAFSFFAPAYGLVAVSPWMPGLYASILLFGLAAWSVPGIIAAAAGDYFGPAGAVSGLTILTLVFAVGQILGPILGGFVAERAGNFNTGFAGAGGAALLCILLSLRLEAPQI